MARRFLGDVGRFVVDDRLVVDCFLRVVLIPDDDRRLGAPRVFRPVSIRGAVRFLCFAICYPSVGRNLQDGYPKF